MEKILGDMQERRYCGVPLKAIHQQMSNNYLMAGRVAEKPTWIKDSEREKTDVLDTLLAVDKMQRQLRHFPAYSGPRPDGTIYTHWKRLDPEGKLLTIII